MIARPVSRRSAALLFLCLSLSAAVSAQETTLRTRSNLVLVPTLVKDSQAGIVYGLQASDFVVEDDGVEQPVHMDEAPEGQPISLVVAIQRGRRASYEFPRMQGLRTMLGPLFELGTSRVALVEFDSQVELTRNFTDREALVDADWATCNRAMMAPPSSTRSPIPSNCCETNRRTASASCFSSARLATMAVRERSKMPSPP